MFFSGVKRALPIVMGYIPIGFAYGVLAREVGLSLVEVVMMSVIVYAGSSQFIAVNLMGRGADPYSIIFTTFLVNLRNMLMSTSLAIKFKEFPKKILPFVAFGITDETFAINSVEFDNYARDSNFVLGLHLAAYIAWLLGSACGGMFYQLIPRIEALGLDFVLYAMFIFLLTIQMTRAKFVLIALLSSLLAIFFNLLFPGNNWYIMVSTIIAATTGVIIESGFMVLKDRYRRKQGQGSRTNENN